MQEGKFKAWKKKEETIRREIVLHAVELGVTSRNLKMGCTQEKFQMRRRRDLEERQRGRKKTGSWHFLAIEGKSRPNKLAGKKKKEE